MQPTVYIYQNNEVVLWNMLRWITSLKAMHTNLLFYSFPLRSTLICAYETRIRSEAHLFVSRGPSILLTQESDLEAKHAT